MSVVTLGIWFHGITWKEVLHRIIPNIVGHFTKPQQVSEDTHVYTPPHTKNVVTLVCSVLVVQLPHPWWLVGKLHTLLLFLASSHLSQMLPPMVEHTRIKDCKVA